MTDVANLDLLPVVARCDWTTAKSYAKTAPHEYVVRGKTVAIEDFTALATAIKDRGYKARWQAVESKRWITGTYLRIDNYRYWWMGVIINRAPLLDETETQRQAREAHETGQ